MSITFSEPVNGMTLASLSLTRNGGPNLLTAVQTLTTSDNQTFTLGSLATLTNVPGTYVFALNANGPGISDLAGNALAAGTSTSFVVNVPAQVTTSADSGPGSLRQALLDSAGAPGLTHTIEFELPAGLQAIVLLSPLPAATDPLIAVLDSSQDVTISAATGAAWDDYPTLTKSGDGTLTLGDASRFDGDLGVADGLLALQAAETPAFGTGVVANVSGAGTLELAGPFSALTASVNIANNSAAAEGVIVEGATQVAGIVSGTGGLAVAADGNLTATRIEQAALIIGGTAGHPARLTIAASLDGGNDLSDLSTVASTVPAATTVLTRRTSVDQPGQRFSAGAPQHSASSPTGSGVVPEPMDQDLVPASGLPAASATLTPFASPPMRLASTDTVEPGLASAAISIEDLVGGSPLPAVWVRIADRPESPTHPENSASQPLSGGLIPPGAFRSPIGVTASAARHGSHAAAVYEFTDDERLSPKVAAILDELFAHEFPQE